MLWRLSLAYSGNKRSLDRSRSGKITPVEKPDFFADLQRTQATPLGAMKDPTMTDTVTLPAEPLAVGIIDATRLLGVGRSTLFEEIRAGRLQARKAGRRTLILRDDLRAWLNTLPSSQSSTEGA